jgi:hypothetical protein
VVRCCCRNDTARVAGLAVLPPISRCIGIY